MDNEEDTFMKLMDGFIIAIAHQQYCTKLVSIELEEKLSPNLDFLGTILESI